MKTKKSLTRALDARHFLGLRIWEFSLRSWPKEYGQLMRRFMLHHPYRTWKGLRAYSRMGAERTGREEIVQLGAGQSGFMEQSARNRQNCIIAVGYCQKPVNPPCPAGRFNHNCVFLGQNTESPACQTCQIKTIGLQALQMDIPFYIMTSAADIVRDILMPSISCGRYRAGIFFLCPYSAEPFIFPLLACNISGSLVFYERGNCADFKQFTLADEGIKSAQTRLSPTALAWWRDLHAQLRRQAN